MFVPNTTPSKKSLEPRNRHSSLEIRTTKNKSISRKKPRKGTSHLVAQDHLGKLKKELRSHTLNSLSKASYSFQHKYSLLVNRLEMLIDSQMFGDTGEAAFPASSGAIDLLCPSEHETTTSDYTSDCQMMDVHTPNYHALPEDMTDQIRTQDEVFVDPETPRASRVSRPLYQCTFKACNFSSHKKADWKRHEESEKHWQQHRYMCILCNVTTIDDTHSSCNFCYESHADITVHALGCEAARTDGKTFAAARRHHFADHLRADHGMAMISAEAASWMFPYDSNWPKQCGFCGVIFSNWEERMIHVSNHFQEGIVISSWKLPFFKPRQFGDRRPGFKPWNDDDNNTPSRKGNYRASYSYGHQSASSLPNRDYTLGFTYLDHQATDPKNNSKRAQKHPATFQCTLCPKRFTRAYNIRSHLRIHERPFVCKLCGNAYTRDSDLKRHKLSLHAQTIGSYQLCRVLGRCMKHGIRTPLASSLYKPLAASQIRLLTILPGSILDPIQCQLTTEDSQTLPSYVALSYTWESSGPQSQILCNNEVIDVTGDLSRTLQTLRYSDKERVLWVDAICVDHSNPFERRRHQVLLMKEIYMNASQVVVLLSKADTHRFKNPAIVRDHDAIQRYLEDIEPVTIQVLKTSNNNTILTRPNWNPKPQIPGLLPVKNIIQTDFSHWLYTLICFTLGSEAEIYEGSGGKLGHHCDAQFHNAYDAITSLCGKIFETLPLPTLVSSFDITRLDTRGRLNLSNRLCAAILSLLSSGWAHKSWRHSDVLLPFVAQKDFKIAPFGPKESCVPVPMYSSEDAYTQPIYRSSWRDMSFRVPFEFSELENEISNNRYCNFCGLADGPELWTSRLRHTSEYELRQYSLRNLDRCPDSPRPDFFWLIFFCLLFVHKKFRFKGYDLGYWPQKHPPTKPQRICAVSFT